MTTAIVCVALIGFEVFGLGLAVSLTRGKTGITYGTPPDPAHILHRMVRAHGNAAEYGALLAVLMLLVALDQPPVWAQWVMAVAVACRYLHAIGLITGKTLDGLNPLRVAGSLGTYITGPLLCIAALLAI